MRKFKVIMEMEMFIDESVSMSDDVKDNVRNGEIIIGHVATQVIDEDGENLMDGEANKEVIDQIMGAFA